MLVQLILAENDSGRSAARMGQGPGHIVAGGAVERIRSAGNQVEIIRVESRDSFPLEIGTAFATAAALANQVHTARRQRRFPVVLAGNCIASLGAVAGLGGSRTGVVWFDGHADLHTPDSTRSGFLDGMALATVAGLCWRQLAASVPGFHPVGAADILLLGARDVEEAEGRRLQELPIEHLGVGQIRGDEARMATAIAELADRVDAIHLHVDLDVLDPELIGPANPLAPPGGLRVEELLGVIARLKGHGRLASATVSAYDPASDPRNAVRAAAIAVLQAIVA